MKYAVIFDTNSYRQFVRGKSSNQVNADVERMILKERELDIKAFGSVIVGLEMIANLVEGTEGANYHDCLNGIVTLGNHCLENSEKGPRILPQSSLQIAHSFFGTVPQSIEKKVKDVGGVIYDFVVDKEAAIKHHESKKTFEDVKNYLKNEEEIFSNQIVNLIKGIELEIKSKHPKIDKRDLKRKTLEFINSGPFEPFISLAIILELSRNLNLQLTQDQSIDRAMQLNLEFPLAIGFFSWISSQIIEKNIDMKSKTFKEKRWNWLWDYHISYAISHNTLDQRETVLVTSDKDIANMLKDFGYSNKVMGIQDYLQFIGFFDND